MPTMISALRRLAPLLTVFGAASTAGWLAIAISAPIVVSVAVKGAHAQAASPARGAGDNLILSKSKVKELLSAAVQRLTGRAFSIGDLDVDLGWQTTISASEVALANADWAQTPDMLTVSKLSATLDLAALLQGRIIAPSIELTKPQVVIAIDRQGDSNLPGVASGTKASHTGKKSKTFDLADLPVIRHLTIREGTLVYRDQRTGSQLEAQIASLQLEGTENQPITISGQGSYDGAPFWLDATGASWETLANADAGPFDFRVESALGPLQVDASGSVQRPLKVDGLQVHVHGEDMPDVYPLKGMLAEKTPAYDLQAHLYSRTKGKGQQFRLSDLRARLGESTLAGHLVAELGRSTPEIRGELTSKLLRMADLTGFLPKHQPEQAVSANGRLLSTRDLPFNALTRMDADLQLAIEELQTSALKMQNVQADLTLQDGILRLQPAQLSIAGGTLTTWVSLYANSDPAQADVIVRGRQLPIGELVNLPLASVPTKGRLGINADLSMTGDSPAALAGSADGQIILMMSQGQIQRIAGGTAGPRHHRIAGAGADRRQ